MEEAVLERVFGGNTARVLDHFIIFREFEYSITELKETLNLDEPVLVEILKHLKSLKLITSTDSVIGTKYRLSPNKATHAIDVFGFEVVALEVKH